MKKTPNRKVQWYFILPIALILFIVPLIVHMRVIPLSGTALQYWKGTNEDYDFFSYYKMLWFLIFTSAALITLFIKLFEEKFNVRKTNIYIPMAVYTVFIILSTLFSKDKEISMFGFPNRYEGMLVLIGYMLIMFAVINLLEDEKQLKILLGGLTISSVIIGIIGMFQYFNMDFFQTMFGKRLMLPASYWKLASNLNFQLGPRAVYATLYHTNYVGSFMSMLFPLSLALFIWTKNITNKVLLGLFTCLMFVNLITCHSRAGIAGGLVAVVVLAIVLRKRLAENWKSIVGILVAFVLIFFGVNSVSQGSLQDKIGTLYNDNEVKQASSTPAGPINDVTVNGNTINLTDNNGTLRLTFQNGQVRVQDEKGSKVPFLFTKANEKITFSQPKYQAYTFYIMNYNGDIVLQMQRDGTKVNFVVTKEGFKFLDNKGQIVDIKPIPTIGFKGMERLGSARGYIWSRSLPLLKNTAVVGYGPDTFAVHFPQEDFLGKLIAYGDPNIIVDKPHNIYLQAGINTGIISLIALLAMFIMYLISSIKLYFNRNFDSLSEITGVGIFVATCGYLISGIFNDSIISVAPVFWILLGIGVSINIMLSGNSKTNRV